MRRPMSKCHVQSVLFYILDAVSMTSMMSSFSGGHHEALESVVKGAVNDCQRPGNAAWLTSMASTDNYDFHWKWWGL